MKKKMIIAVLTMSMVLGAGSASYAAEKAASCTDTAECGQTMTAVQLCGAQTAQDFEALCKGQIDFETLCKAQNPGNTQNKNDKDNKEDQDDSSKNEQVSAGQSSMTSQVVNLVNSERAAQGLTALQKDSRLAALAQQKAEDMAKNQYFSHTSPTYGSAFDMLKAAGYSYKTAGENIAMGQKSAASVMDGWMHSPGHRANILHTSYEKIGVGYAVSADGMPYWVQIFAG